MTITHPTLALFGGSGATGREVIRQGLAREIKIKALARNADAFKECPAGLEIIEGSLLEAADVERTLQDCTAVCCVFGPRPPYTDLFCAPATVAIVAAMHKLNIHRLVCQTGGMIGDYPDNRSLAFKAMVRMFNSKMPAGARDRTEQERIIKESGLEWTIVKPSRLTLGPAKGRVVAGPWVKLGMLSSISRADLAAFLIRELFQPAHAGQAVFIKN
jgi:uncharacterized protein YbjT (DUF2867 family)